MGRRRKREREREGGRVTGKGGGAERGVSLSLPRVPSPTR